MSVVATSACGPGHAEVLDSSSSRRGAQLAGPCDVPMGSTRKAILRRAQSRQYRAQGIGHRAAGSPWAVSGRCGGRKPWCREILASWRLRDRAAKFAGLRERLPREHRMPCRTAVVQPEATQRDQTKRDTEKTPFPPRERKNGVVQIGAGVELHLRRPHDPAARALP